MTRRNVATSVLIAATWPLMAGSQALQDLRVDGRRLNEHLSALSEFGKNAQGGVTRLAYTESDLQARAYTIGLMRAADLSVSIDAAGNLVGRRPGSDPALPHLSMGSHIDSVPGGGSFDGNVGSLGAIEVAQTLADKKIKLQHPLEIVIFQNEEGGLIGSTALGRGLTDQELALVSRSGKTIREGIAILGGDLGALATAKRKPGEIGAYLELHVEQGGILDDEKIQIGVVEGIVGNGRWDVKIEGFANHAGSTPMNQRHDAMLAAAKVVVAVNRIAMSMPGRQVGTVGRIEALPGAYNVIPDEVTLGLDLRDLDSVKIEHMHQQLTSDARQIANETGTRIQFKELTMDVPAPTDPRIRQSIVDSSRALGLTTKTLPSGATHDAQNMARVGPIGMIFVPSVAGISHSPREFSRADDITNGANVLLHTLLKLDHDLKSRAAGVP